ncbi:MAG: hypothetical protein J6I64_02915, partial [Lachnospiraceae bacterium]|nr:hypothetical protein [Lachnospiraceae bacterium]
GVAHMAERQHCFHGSSLFLVLIFYSMEVEAQGAWGRNVDVTTLNNNMVVVSVNGTAVEVEKNRKITKG